MGKTKFEPELKFISTSKQKYNLKFQKFETDQSQNRKKTIEIYILSQNVLMRICKPHLSKQFSI